MSTKFWTRKMILPRSTKEEQSSSQRSVKGKESLEENSTIKTYLSFSKKCKI